MQLHDTLSRRRSTLAPIVPGQISLYVCGITVYDRCHIGHARMLVTFDILYRHLLSQDYRVTYVRNITDVDDKIIRRAGETGETIEQLTERSIGEMHEDAAALNVLPPTHEPRATEKIDAMIELIGRLIDSKHAYSVPGADVYYSVSSFEGYGKLSGRKLSDLRAGERVAIDEHKRDPLDFVLWKAARPGEPSWPSPWGDGRPGWHIECSAMARSLLGDHFDIHGGGSDLVFPHHENEIAQSEACSGTAMANLWMHNGMVRTDDEKMSKSLGNFFTIHDVLQQFTGEELRLFIVSSHYRSPLNYATSHLEAARAALRRLYIALRGHVTAEQSATGVTAPKPLDRSRLDSTLLDRFDAAMNDDMNTPEAMAVLFDAASQLNRASTAGDDGPETREHVQRLADTLRALGGRLGLLQGNPEDVLKGQAMPAQGGLDDAAIEVLLARRLEARAARDFATSDAVRDELLAAGVILEDGSEGTTWRRA